MDGGGEGKASSNKARPPKLFCLAVFSERKERGGEGFWAPCLAVCGVFAMLGGFLFGVGGRPCLLSLFLVSFRLLG